jgi:hypothetical protein
VALGTLVGSSTLEVSVQTGVYHMAELDFEIKGAKGDIAASTFERAVANAVGLLREFDSAISGKPHGLLRWYIARLHSNGTLLISFRSKLKPTKRKERELDNSGAVSGSFLTGMDVLENKCEVPSYLSEFGLQKVDALTSLIGKNGATGFRFASSSQSVDVTAKTSENVAKLLPIKRKSIGSVEGKLEAINIHNTPRMIVYHNISKKAVTCNFDAESLMERVKNYLGRRVVAFGELHKNVNGDTLRLNVERLVLADDIRKESRSQPTASGVPEFAKTLSTAEYIRRIRGG